MEKIRLKDFNSIEEIHEKGFYIADQGRIFSEESKKEKAKDFSRFIATEHFSETAEWLNSITESGWNKLFECLKLLENEHKKNIKTIQDLQGANMYADCSGVLEAIKYLQQSLNHIGFMLLAGGAIADNVATITAIQNRAKRKPHKNLDIDQSRKLAIEIWGKSKSIALLDVAYEIKQKINTRKGVGTIQEWIRDLNPNAKKKKSK